MVSYSLGRVTSGKLVYSEVNEVKSIHDKILTHTLYNRKKLYEGQQHLRLIEHKLTTGLNFALFSNLN